MATLYVATKALRKGNLTSEIEAVAPSNQRLGPGVNRRLPG
jgi:hypothetical protein